MVRDYVRRLLEARWYGQAGWLRILTPLSALYNSIAQSRRRAAMTQSAQDESSTPTPHTPVVVIGNIVAGGTGKTPVVMHVVERLCKQGVKAGVVARGYGANSAIWPRVVTPLSNPGQCGDEAVELATHLGCPVVVGPDRAAAARWLHELFDCEVIVSDDGLQHYRLERDLEVLLPVGPLREPVARLQSVDCVIETARSLPVSSPSAGNGLARGSVSDAKIDAEPVQGIPRLQGLMRPVSATHLLSNETVTLANAPFVGNHCVALSGIGNPDRFHADLFGFGCTLTPRVLADHASYTGFNPDWPRDSWVVTTGKDAVKLRSLAAAGGSGWLQQVWVLNRQLVFSATDQRQLDLLLQGVMQEQTPSLPPQESISG